MSKKTITIEIEYCDARPEEQQHCWHRSPFTYTTCPPQWDETCCYCGQTKRVHGSMRGSVTYPNEHGPHYRSYISYNV